MSDTTPPRDDHSLFEPQFNYSAADISRKTGLPGGTDPAPPASGVKSSTSSRWPVMA